ncbi:MAG: hypothetical protein AAGG07_04055 [Planctomycetota bacterium]
MNRRNDRSRDLRAAFSLVEVLIAVLVLSLGLLGLGAVLPVVVREQRLANETSVGVQAADAAVDALRTLDGGRVALSAPGAEVGFDWRSFAVDYLDEFGGTKPPSFNEYETGDWYPLAINQGVNNANIQGESWASFLSDEFQPVSLLRLRDPGPSATGATLENAMRARRSYIPLAQRLVPSPGSAAGPPLFVWDLATRVLAGDPAAATGPLTLQVAVFVQQIDAGIRPARLEDVDGDPPAERADMLLGNPVVGLDRGALAAPVALDGRNGRLTGTGLAAGGFDDTYHAGPIVVRLADSQNFPDPGVAASNPCNERTRLRIEVDGAQARSWYDGTEPSGWTEAVEALLAQPGQRFVIGDGTVYTVLGTDRSCSSDADHPVVLLDRPLPDYVSRASELGAIVFTPKPPAAIRLFTIEVD